MRGIRRFIRHVSHRYWLGAAFSLLIGAGCCETFQPPDQETYAPLGQLAFRREALVRAYGAPIPLIGSFAIHTWLVTKRADSVNFRRWEIWFCPQQDTGFVCVDILEADSDIGIGDEFVIGELSGILAESVVDFIEREAANYPRRESYVPVPGPNSNTFTQWVFDQTGWGLQLPDCAVGARWTPRNGWSETDE